MSLIIIQILPRATLRFPGQLPMEYDTHTSGPYDCWSILSQSQVMFASVQVTGNITEVHGWISRIMFSDDPEQTQPEYFFKGWGVCWDFVMGFYGPVGTFP